MDSKALPDDYTIYQGVWTNWTYGRIFGATLTLNRRDGALLIAFIALFVTLIGTSFWRLICYAFHYYRSTESPRDGLHHQIQATLRNAANGTSGAWNLISILNAWKRESKQPYRRVLPLLILTVVIISAFAAASGFSSRISSMGSEVLIRSNYCGMMYVTKDESISDLYTVIAPYARQRDIAHTNYASQCYNHSNPESCSMYVKNRLRVETTRNASCPFGGDICTRPNNSLILDSGLINLHDDLGVNLPSSQHIYFRYKTQCSPLKVEPYQTLHNHTSESGTTTLARYHYGEQATRYSYNRNFTYEYWANSTRLDDGPATNADYTVSHRKACRGNGTYHDTSSTFYPIPELAYPDADIALVFLSANEIEFAQEISDDWYAAHQPSNSTRTSLWLGNNQELRTYKQDTPVSVLACASQKQWCLADGTCTPLSSEIDVKGPAESLAGDDDDVKSKLLYWVVGATMQSEPSLESIISSLGSQALTSRTSLFDGVQGPLPGRQWQHEVESWFNIALARIQATYVDIAIGSADEAVARHIKRPKNKQERYLCNNQKIRSTVYTNISLFGLILILSIGTIIILLSNFIETLVSFILRRRRADIYAHLEWGVNETLQLQRLAHEGVGLGQWKKCGDMVPITEMGDMIGVLDVSEAWHVKLKAPVMGWEKEAVVSSGLMTM
ncbi:uncharacterized protein K452DRAFT_297623 [Aplosporella prunicola CBS 121167]|uniref:Uncharacterized protein n=1 Tax=Aplosporella prunicola CBS 121167 TaxID=1176127 RepID=A0A6A6BG87_9PEZI|nr:uncharacterized protein K452DRAFT_297623 [Aplosporella prunicola CBS 121167]KAF2142305.1 hypothetical protein K452DRAFT_297623 [Aplosporella prunicola CBS 121167]